MECSSEMEITRINAGDFFPKIILPTISGYEINISEPYQKANWQLIIFYRGGHSSRCTEFLNKLEKIKSNLLEYGISISAASADDGAQLQQQLHQLSVSFPIAYGLSIAQMHELNLYISLPHDFSETNHPFCEPGMFVVNELGQIIVLNISNSDVCRPELATLLTGLIELKQTEQPSTFSGSF